MEARAASQQLWFSRGLLKLESTSICGTAHQYYPMLGAQQQNRVHQVVQPEEGSQSQLPPADFTP